MNLDVPFLQVLHRLGRQHSYNLTAPAKSAALISASNSLLNYNAQYLADLLPMASDSFSGDTSSNGSICGRVFKKGEQIYRCRSCALDDTCVLCATCFRSSGGHVGHDVVISISGTGGGCCDCGDMEAWATPLACSVHTPSQAPVDDRDMPDALRTSIHRAVRSIVEYVLFAAKKASQDLVLGSMTEIEQAGRVAWEEESLLTGGFTQAEETKYAHYGCLLWNDETHSFNEVIDCVSEACNCTRAAAKKVAENVDIHACLLFVPLCSVGT
jgi:E3 ubiquitin-protein ligase UBR1